MLQTRKYTLLWLTGGIVFSLLVLLTVSGGLAGNVTVTEPESIQEAVDTAMSSLRDGDWNTLEDMVSNAVGLTPVTGKPGSPEAMIYDTFRSSLQWSCEDTFTVKDHCIVQEVNVTCLDIQGITQSIAAVLKDSANETVTQQLLQSATRQVLETDLPLIQRTIPLAFRREQNRWMLIPDHSLQVLISGFTTH